MLSSENVCLSEAFTALVSSSRRTTPETLLRLPCLSIPFAGPFAGPLDSTRVGSSLDSLPALFNLWDSWMMESSSFSFSRCSFQSSSRFCCCTAASLSFFKVCRAFGEPSVETGAGAKPGAAAAAAAAAAGAGGSGTSAARVEMAVLLLERGTKRRGATDKELRRDSEKRRGGRGRSLVAGLVAITTLSSSQSQRATDGTASAGAGPPCRHACSSHAHTVPRSAESRQQAGGRAGEVRHSTGRARGGLGAPQRTSERGAAAEAEGRRRDEENERLGTRTPATWTEHRRGGTGS